MPLAPLPASNTKRYFLGLADSIGQHHIQIRVTDALTDAAALVDFQALCTAMQPVTFSDYTYNELLVAEHGSDIRNPVAGWTSLPGTNSFAQADHDAPLMITARGRSASGRKVRFSWWGQFFTVPTNWLYVPAALSVHAALLAQANASPGAFLAIDGTKPVWQENYTVDYNDHWVEAMRP